MMGQLPVLHIMFMNLGEELFKKKRCDPFGWGRVYFGDFKCQQKKNLTPP